jgi:hypothetical protein
LYAVRSVADDPTSFQSSFAFDPDREGRYLLDLLAGLDSG